jgi:hypothetical protein
MFTWHFFTGGRPVDPVGRRCHRGPMTDLEVAMSKAFVTLTEYNSLRKRLLDGIVDTQLAAVQTREVVLRCINGSLNSMFTQFPQAQRELLEVPICEKKNSIDIQTALASLHPFYLEAARGLFTYGLSQQYVEVVTEALQSNSPIVVVEGMCATILWATLFETGTQDG